MLRLFSTLMLLLLVSNGFCLLFNRISDNESQSSPRLLQHRHSSGGILALKQSESGGVVNPQTKTAAKAVACKSIGKGICAGVAAVKYTEKEFNESNVSESGIKPIPSPTSAVK